MHVLTPFSAESDDTTQFMDSFRQLPSTVQRVIIAIILVVILVAVVLLRDMVKTEESTRGFEETMLDTSQ